MDSSSTINYIPILIIFVFASGFATLMMAMPGLLARKRPTPVKQLPYECGVEPVGTARARQSVKFYLVAMAFLLFDIEAVFLVPWAVVFRGVLEREEFRSLKYVFYGEMMLFVFILFVGLIFVWRMGVLEWNK